jgi:hypothetical protein
MCAKTYTRLGTSAPASKKGSSIISKNYSNYSKHHNWNTARPVVNKCAPLNPDFPNVKGFKMSMDNIASLAKHILKKKESYWQSLDRNQFP